MAKGTRPYPMQRQGRPSGLCATLRLSHRPCTLHTPPVDKFLTHGPLYACSCPGHMQLIIGHVCCPPLVAPRVTCISSHALVPLVNTHVAQTLQCRPINLCVDNRSCRTQTRLPSDWVHPMARRDPPQDNLCTSSRRRRAGRV